jgi:hypothetical protein
MREILTLRRDRHPVAVLIPERRQAEDLLPVRGTSAAAIRAAAKRLGVPADTIVEVDGIGPQAAVVEAARA